MIIIIAGMAGYENRVQYKLIVGVGSLRAF
jgi:hypothetical protein